jgi:hypothetical protein
MNFHSFFPEYTLWKYRPLSLSEPLRRFQKKEGQVYSHLLFFFNNLALSSFSIPGGGFSKNIAHSLHNWI